MVAMAVIRLTRNISFFQIAACKGFSPIHRVYFLTVQFMYKIQSDMSEREGGGGVD